MSRIGVGTVQFGLDYGVTNGAGRPAPEEVESICRLAHGAGIDILDTAHLYGTSEAVLGATAAAAQFRIVTKTPKFGEVVSAAEASDRLRAALVVKRTQQDDRHR